MAALLMNRLMRVTKNRVTVPDDLEAVTTRDVSAECRPEAVGMSRQGVEAIWSAVEDLYRTGLQPAISMVLRRHGQVVIKRSIGYARGGGPGDEGIDPMLVTPDTPICLFSASKAVTAMLIHKLAELGKLRLDDAVTDYLPEYGVGGKGDTTIRHLLAHRAGIPQVAISDVDPSVIFDWESAVQMLCNTRPAYKRDTYQAYHAITAGFILGEVARRVGGASLHTLLKRWIAKPLGCDHMTYGLPKKRQDRVARNYFTGPNSTFPMTVFARRILGVGFEEVVDLSNDEGFLDSVIPAGNIYATADDLGRFYQMMLNQGELDGNRVFKQETIAEATRPYGHITLDRTLLLPIRFTAGMMMGEWPVGLYGQDCPNAYGHLGFLSILGWADPDRGIAVSFLNTGKSLAVPNVLAVSRVIYLINRECRKV